MNRLAGVLPALGLVLFLPQFSTAPPVRIGHGVLLGVGLLWLALEGWRSRDGRGALDQPA